MLRISLCFLFSFSILNIVNLDRFALFWMDFLKLIIKSEAETSFLYSAV